MMAGGAAVDYGNWVSVQARLQAAVDAAALAAGREANMSDEDLQKLAVNYFNANFGNPRNIGQPEMTLTVKENAIRVDAHVEVENYLMKAIGIDSQVVATFAEVSKEATNLDVVLVFDNTGSMAKEPVRSPRNRLYAEGVVPFIAIRRDVGPDKAGRQLADTEGKHVFAGQLRATRWHNWMAWENVNRLSRKHTWAGCIMSSARRRLAVDTEGKAQVMAGQDQAGAAGTSGWRRRTSHG